MKNGSKIFLIIALLAGVVIFMLLKRGSNYSSSGSGKPAASNSQQAAALENMTASKPAAEAASRQIIAYYFHGTVRCTTCLAIEQQAKALMEQRFTPQLASQRLLFIPVNYDLPENRHFIPDYKLPCPSLVLVQKKNGVDEKWKLLGDTWQLITEPAKFDNYVETEIRGFLEQIPSDGSLNSAQPPASAER